MNVFINLRSIQKSKLVEIKMISIWKLAVCFSSLDLLLSRPFFLGITIKFYRDCVTWIIWYHYQDYDYKSNLSYDILKYAQARSHFKIKDPRSCSCARGSCRSVGWKCSTLLSEFLSWYWWYSSCHRLPFSEESERCALDYSLCCIIQNLVLVLPEIESDSWWVLLLCHQNADNVNHIWSHLFTSIVTGGSILRSFSPPHRLVPLFKKDCLVFIQSDSTCVNFL